MKLNRHEWRNGAPFTDRYGYTSCFYPYKSNEGERDAYLSLKSLGMFGRLHTMTHAGRHFVTISIHPFYPVTGDSDV